MNGVPAPSHRPFVPDSASLDEFTLRAVVMGALLGMLFGASSLYLVLKVGLTVSASIPVAVIAIALFRLASKAGVRDSTILENNIVQTAGSAGESIAFGPPVKGGSVGAEISPELLGVGYIIGPRIASIMCAGGVLAYLLLIPLIKFFGDALPVPLAPGAKLIHDMSPNQIRGAYVLYIGAGAVAAGGVVSLVKALPMIWRSLGGSLKGYGGGAGGAAAGRTDQDIPMKWVLVGCLAIIIAIMLSPPLHMNLLGALLILVFGFLFSTVSSQLTGEIGSSSNPISGMTVATLLLTCLIFLVVGWTGGPYYVTALSVGAIVCIASSNAGSTSQDLKTGFLIGATPRLQQIAILAGALASAVVLGPILLKLNDAATVYVPIAQVAPGLRTDAAALAETAVLQGPQALKDAASYRVWHKTDLAGGPAGKYLVDDAGRAVYLVDPGINGSHTTRPDGTQVRKYDAPKAVLMSYIIKGILDQQLPWALVIFGVVIALVLEMAKVPSLPFAVGVYLPLSSSAPIFVGGMVRWVVDRRRNKLAAYANASEEERAAAGDRSPGVLLASGYIAGGALAGILIAFTAGVLGDFDKAVTAWSAAHNPFFEGGAADLLSLLPYAALIVLLYWMAREKSGR